MTLNYVFFAQRRKHVQNELDKALEDAPEYQRRAETAEVEKSKVLTELLGARRTIEGLKLNLDKAQTEALQAQQDSELANIRFKEIQQGIASKESAAIQAEIELAKHRHESALAELQSVKDELEQLQKEYHSLNTQKDNAKVKACESSTASQEIEKTVENHTLDLITLKELLTSSQATHIVAQEQKINATLAYQQEKVNCQNELKQADEEVQKLSDAMSLNRDLESKLKAASATLVDLQDGFSSYLEEMPPPVVSLAEESEQPTVSTRLKLARTTKELEDMRADIERAKDEVKGLWNAAATLRADIERENTDITALRHKEHLAALSSTSLQEEMRMTICELHAVRERMKAAEMPVEVQKATEELEQAKSRTKLAANEAAKAREEADQVKAKVNVTKLRLEAASKEIHALNASEEIATASANALSEYKQGAEIEPQADRRMTLSIEQYRMLNKKAQEAEDLVKKHVIRATDKIKEAKQGEVRSLDQLEQLTKQIDARRLELKAAQEKSSSAQYGKLTMENELGKLRANHEQQPNGSWLFDATASTSKPHMAGALPRAETIAATRVKGTKPRKSFLPRSIVTMFTSRKKTHLK
jgi:chromosome segregation ATPase